MTVEAPEIEANCKPGLPAIGRKPASVLRLVQVDRRTALGRRIAEIARNYVDALGGEASLSAVMLERIATAAEMAAAAELARQRFLAGDGTISADDLVRMQNLSARAETRLGIRVEPPKPPERRPFRDRVRGAAA